MDSDHQRRKRKRLNRANEFNLVISFRSLTLCISFFLFILLHFSFSDHSLFRPVILRFTGLIRLHHNRLTPSDPPIPPHPLIESRILLPDYLLLILSNKLRRVESLDCVYHRSLTSSDDGGGQILFRPAISADDYQESKSIVRCELPPPGNYSAATVDLRRLRNPANRTAEESYYDGGELVYEAILDWDAVVVLAKGLNLKPRKEADPSGFRCHFGLTGFNRRSDRSFVITTEATAAAQEVVRCLLPRSIRISNNGKLAEGIRVTISHVSESNSVAMPSVAKVYNPKSLDIRFDQKKKYEICACTMMWNQAAFLKEWVTYHAWLGVERWFIYDNDSDDGIQDIVEELESYNVTRHVWPWPKSQEAGFSHCALRAKYECDWVGFFDVDEFFYFPRYYDSYPTPPGRNSLRALVSNYTDSPIIAEVRTTCRSFGPSGLTKAPQQGVTMGYTCRLQAPERHKSFVRPELLDSTLLNIIHHFKLKEGYGSVNVGETTAVINHYKYQVWDSFKAKFFRRVSTYVANWRDDHNKGSKDRAPGLGTEAVEPEDWRLRFCEVWDTGLKDFVLDTFADVATGFLPWEDKSSGI